MYRCFYFDSPENARKNGMAVNTKYEKDIEERYVVHLPRRTTVVEVHNDSLRKTMEEVEAHGGKVVGLDDPKLTHIVMDKRDICRRLALMERTAR